MSKIEGLNTQKPNGSWNLHGSYVQYRKDGGVLSPQGWNDLVTEITKQNNVDSSVQKVQEEK